MQHIQHLTTCSGRLSIGNSLFAMEATIELLCSSFSLLLNPCYYPAGTRNPEPSFISPTWNEHQRLFKVYVDCCCCCCCSCCNEIAQPLIFSGDPSGRDFGFWFALSWQRCPSRKRNGVLIHLVERITVLIYIEISDKFQPAGESFTGSSPLDFRCKQFQC